jgi:hypothetical protein
VYCLRDTWPLNFPQLVQLVAQRLLALGGDVG